MPNFKEILIVAFIVLAAIGAYNYFDLGHMFNSSKLSIRDLTLNPQTYENQVVTVYGKATDKMDNCAYNGHSIYSGLASSDGYFIHFEISSNKIYEANRYYTITGRIVKSNNNCYLLVEDVIPTGERIK